MKIKMPINQLRVTRVTVALEVDLPKFKDNKVGRLISLVCNTYDQRSLC